MSIKIDYSTVAIIVVLLGTVPGSAVAADTGAVGNGNWSSAATWTGGVPGFNDVAYIGSTYPTGAAANAAVTLSQNSLVGGVYLGYGSGNSGTFDLGGFTLAASALELGANGGTASVMRTGGGTLSLGATNNSGIVQSGGSFSFAPGDTATQLILQGNSIATTAAVGNVDYHVIVGPGCTLILGADMSVNTSFFLVPQPDVDINGTLNANGHTLSALNLNLGRTGGPFTLIKRGPINVGDLGVSSAYSPSLTNFNLTAADRVRDLYLYGVNTALPAGTTLSSLNLTYNGPSAPTPSTATTSVGVTIGVVALFAGSSLSVQDFAGQTTGLTISGTSAGDLVFGSGSPLELEVNGDALGWILRWANPSGGNHIADLQSYISAGEITFSYVNGGTYSLSADSSYTYVNVIPVPEPSGLILSTAAAGLLGRGLRGKLKNHRFPNPNRNPLPSASM